MRESNASMSETHLPLPAEIGREPDGAEVRGTQSFVHTLSACWQRPSLTGLEILWRWVLGIPALAVLAHQAMRIAATSGVNWVAVQNFSLTDLSGGSAVLARAGELLGPAVLPVMLSLGPLLIAAWIVVSALGRTAMLRRADPRLHSRAGTLMVLHAVRALALAGFVAVWFACVRWAGGATVTGPLAAGGDPNLVLYCALVIVVTLGMFTLWAAVSWPLGVAPLMAMLRNAGPAASIAAAMRLGPLRSKLAEINLVMGIVKIALLVLALVFSATPLPFETIATPEFMAWWYAGVAVVWTIASDFFHVVRLVSYLDLWRATREIPPSR
jgi:hypothetical protein